MFDARQSTLGETLVKGDPRERNVLKQTAQQVLGSILPGSKSDDERS